MYTVMILYERNEDIIYFLFDSEETQEETAPREEMTREEEKEREKGKERGKNEGRREGGRGRGRDKRPETTARGTVDCASWWTER